MLGGERPLATPPLAGGRLLVYEPDNNMACGLAQCESNGFFDVNNTPPWDRWIGYIHEPRSNYLLSWVPHAYISIAQSGLDVNPEMCIQWLDSSGFALSAELQLRRIN